MTPDTTVAQRVTVLLVDDDEMILRASQRKLTQVDVVVATSVAAAQAVLIGLCPAAVLTDYDLGDGTGHDVLQATKKLCPTAQRILISGNAAAIPPSQLQIADEIVHKGTPELAAMLSRINALQP